MLGKILKGNKASRLTQSIHTSFYVILDTCCLDTEHKYWDKFYNVILFSEM